MSLSGVLDSLGLSSNGSEITLPNGVKLNQPVTAAQLAAMLDRVGEGLSSKDETLIDSFAVVLDANGNGTAVMTRVPSGKIAYMHRVDVEAAGYTYAAPFAAASTSMTFHRGRLGGGIGSLIAGITGSATVAILPMVWTAGSDAPKINSSEEIVVKIVGSATVANVAVVGTIQGVLLPSLTPGRL